MISLVTAQVEKTVNHARVIEIVELHPHDLTKYFARLTEMGGLQRGGIGRGTVYFLPDAAMEDEITEEIFGISTESSGGLAGKLQRFAGEAPEVFGG